MSLAALVWPPGGSVAGHSPDDWKTIAVLAVASLRERLGVDLVSSLEGPFECGFCESVGADVGAWVQWRGVVGAAAWVGVGAHVSASLFVYVAGQRVAPPGLSHIEAELERTPDGAAWVIRGWQADEYGEYGAFDTPGPLAAHQERTA
jgi:hypothetical protein